jgi:lipid-A-disaccharide synthase
MSDQTLAFFVGDFSGDAHLATFLSLIPGNHYGVAGAHVEKQGYEILTPLDELCVNGFFLRPSVLKTVWAALDRFKKEVKRRKTKFILLVDYGGVNLPLARWAYEEGLTVFYHIPPKTWAHGSSRLKRLRQFTHYRSVVYPFEKTYFENEKLETEFWGNPLLSFEDRYASNRVLLLVSGSRSSEIKKNLPRLLKGALLWKKNHPEWRFALSFSRESLKPLMENIWHESLSSDEKKLLGESLSWHLGLFPSTPVEFAWCAMGTAAFEVSFAQIPNLSFYRLDVFSYALAKWIVRSPYANLTNLCLNQLIVPELFQNQVQPDVLCVTTEKILKKIETQKQSFEKLKSLFPPSAETHLADFFLKSLTKGPLW